jgi:hypothetical protein
MVDARPVPVATPTPDPDAMPPVVAGPVSGTPDALAPMASDAAGAEVAPTSPPTTPATCTVGEVVCLGRMPQMCGADGKWVNGELCTYACEGGCVNKFAAVSAGRGAPTNGDGVAEFSRNAVTFYSERGGLFGARGFNVVVLDPTTGATIEPVKNFDAWDSPLTGNSLKAMAAYLDAIQAGRLVMIAACDDAGIARPNSCDKFDSEPVKEVITALQKLGSKQIVDYCFRGAWSFAAITGQGRALAEKVSTGAKVAAEVVLPAAP